LSPPTEAEEELSEPRFPAGWVAARVQRLPGHDESLSEEQVAEDEAALAGQKGQVVITVPQDLLPALRQLLARHRSA
jgi:hypothetical protein